jgi:hypothetical protein
VGPIQGADRASRVQPPREPPLTPTGSVVTSGAPATPVVGTGTVSHASDCFVPKPARPASGLPLVAWLACGAVFGVVRRCPPLLPVIVTHLVTHSAWYRAATQSARLLQ